MEVRRLNDKIRSIRAEQIYQRQQEEQFRDLSEEINEKVVWWSLLQAAVIVGSAVFQLFHLRGFFKSKKLM